MLAGMELTPELLTEGLKQQELSQVLFYFSYPSPRVQRVEVQAFRGREDGSAVFYLWLEVLPMEGLDEDHRLVMYDTRTGTFAEFRGRVPDSYLEPPNLSEPPLQWEKDPGFRAYS